VDGLTDQQIRADFERRIRERVAAGIEQAQREPSAAERVLRLLHGEASQSPAATQCAATPASPLLFGAAPGGC
jgi:hypothetical protein